MAECQGLHQTGRGGFSKEESRSASSYIQTRPYTPGLGEHPLEEFTLIRDQPSFGPSTEYGYWLICPDGAQGKTSQPALPGVKAPAAAH